MQLSGVRPFVSVRLFHSSAADAGLLLWDQQTGDIDQLLHGRRVVGQQQPRRAAANAGTATLSAKERG